MVSRPLVMAQYFTQQPLTFVTLAISSREARLEGVHQMGSGQALYPSVSQVMSAQDYKSLNVFTIIKGYV